MKESRDIVLKTEVHREERRYIVTTACVKRNGETVGFETSVFPYKAGKVFYAQHRTIDGHLSFCSDLFHTGYLDDNNVLLGFCDFKMEDLANRVAKLENQLKEESK